MTAHSYLIIEELPYEGQTFRGNYTTKELAEYDLKILESDLNISDSEFFIVKVESNRLYDYNDLEKTT